MTRLAAAVATMVLFAASARVARAESPHTYRLAVDLADGATVRHFDVQLDGVDCDQIEDWTEDRGKSDQVDQVHVCARDTSRGTDVQVEWSTRRGASLSRLRSSTIAALGKPITIGRAGGPRLTVTLR